MFVRRCEILDFWHAMEKAWAFARLRFGEESWRAAQFADRIAKDLRSGKVADVIARLKTQPTSTEEQREALDALVRYDTDHIGVLMRSRPGSFVSHPALESTLPEGFRTRLETARLDLRALFRAADQLHVAQHLPDELQRLFELDADFAEALHVMDLSPPSIDVHAMRRDTEASLDEVKQARADFLATLEGSTRKRLEAQARIVRQSLRPENAYLDVPGRDPTAT
jgi:hypothetical protein